jgi:4-amino-4-deoxy-L-arabinose transferase-like glycosyltransferase
MDKNFNRYLTIIVFFALIVRLIPIFISGPQKEYDTQEYLEMGQNLAVSGQYSWLDPVENRVMPYAYRMPLFPVMAAIAFKFFPKKMELYLAILNIFFSILTLILMAYCFYILTDGNAESALLSAFLMAINTNSIYNSILLLTDTLFNFASMMMIFTTIIAIKYRKPFYFFLCGISMGVATLARPILKYFWFLLAILTLFAILNESMKRKIKFSFLIVFGFYLIVFPWLLRNHSKLNFWGMDTHQGIDIMYSMKDLIKPSTEDEYKKDPYFSKVRDIVAMNKNSTGAAHFNLRKELNLGPVEANELLSRVVMETALKNPFKVFRKTILNFIKLIGSPRSELELISVFMGKGNHYFPNVSDGFQKNKWQVIFLNLPFALLHFIFFIMAVSGFYKIWKDSKIENKILLLAPLAFCFYIIALTSFVDGYDRYRLPIEPFIIGFASIWLINRVY